MGTSTLQEISDDLACYGGSEKTWHQLVETIAKLPDAVISFVSERCRFLPVGRAERGYVLPGRVAAHWLSGKVDDMWLVVLEDSSELEDCSIIAHEIAHAWLRHDRLSDIGLECETQAANLVREWGFAGIGAEGS